MKTIFIVDDNPTNLVAAQQALSGTYKTLQITSAEKMFALLEKVRPDLILLDIEMPETDGFAAMEKLRLLDKSIPVVFLTASTDEANEIRGFELGAVDFIIKPFSKPILLKRLETHLDISSIVNQRTAALQQSKIDNDKLKNGIVAVLADMVEGRDKASGGHIERTQRYLEILVEEMMRTGVYAEELASWDLSVAIPSAQLHDIGKIAVSDLILNKPGKLTNEEFEKMKLHARIGEEIVDRITSRVGIQNATFLYYARLFAGAHHEKWNGRGYPYGFAGEEIPLEGRILAIADVYDALTSARIYKPAFSREKAAEIIQTDSGTHFDPKIVEVFRAVESQFWAEAKQH